ncbi:bifunctional ADP-dependent NAD(P)H-hydrate dehydratase/NAD(P)H-hydrate epimerase [Marinobacterium litorale]|jgi:NAD(P)H-hydrate epimerase|uniref:bifunctional ADP-dependent NAD(P)H-hydrate dehydratase/NAD(P)H-hydrate epimerase n=1 Tax=Marinobacterium litorale TaxID=404770 RepID=UPI000413B787|nr:bifunctional ADP-dependent NAD(P)H-hydrate dehydratase/NAD(P)H-hydrate epimerase [Marinobacterium litorale]
MSIDRTRLPATLYTAEQCHALDRAAIEQFGIPGFRLMQRAAQAAWAVLQQYWPGVRRVTVICGGGNNGGDGLVVAGLAAQAGLDVQLVVVGEGYASRLQNEARDAWNWLSSTEVSAEPWVSGMEFRGELIVDALLGIGLKGEVRGDAATVIAQLNRSGIDIFSIDTPSGLCADSGRVLGCAVKATRTLTFIALKQGLFTHEGVDHTGELLFDGLLLPEDVFEEVPVSAFRTDDEDLRELLPPRERSAHKGCYGHLLVIGGDQGMGGAPLMAAMAALRSGAGLVSLATRPEHCLAALVKVPEVMAHGVESADELEPLLASADAVVVGPGLGKADWGCELLGAALASGKPLVVDADALNLIAGADAPVQEADWIMTPHPGEAARLLGVSTDQIQSNRFEQAREIQARFGGVTVLKGAGSLTCDGDVIHLCSDGNPGMATAGMGDTLSGIIGALLAQRLDPVDAARLGVMVHARAADRVALQRGSRGLLATDLLEQLPMVINGLELND